MLNEAMDDQSIVENDDSNNLNDIEKTIEESDFRDNIETKI